jgi:hypothetical protein
MSIEAMKLALEAFKKLGDFPHAFDECTNAIKALEEALAKQEQGEPDELTIAYMSGLHRGKDFAQQRKPLTDEEINKAAMKLAECMDYPWVHMPEEGKRNMRKHAKAVIEAAHGIKE